MHKCYAGVNMVPGEGYIYHFYVPPLDVSQIGDILTHIREVVQQNVGSHQVMGVQYDPQAHMATVIIKAGTSEPCTAVRDRINQALAQATGGTVKPVTTPGGLDWRTIAVLGILGLGLAYVLTRKSP